MSLKRGFTMVELLVVVAIIGVLMAAGLVAFSAAQKRSRDSRRVSDLRAMQRAFEQYMNANGTYNTCRSSMVVGYLASSSLPTDPTNSGSFVYTLDPGFASCSAPTTSFCVCAKMEVAGSGNTPNANCTSFTSAGSKDYFCVFNSQ